MCLGRGWGYDFCFRGKKARGFTRFLDHLIIFIEGSHRNLSTSEVTKNRVGKVHKGGKFSGAA